MLPGPIRIIKAPGCQNLLKVETLLSGNTFEAIFWSDGKMEAPMLPDQPWLRKSPSEKVLFWMDEVEKVGETYPGRKLKGKDEAWEALEFAKAPSEKNYFQALEAGLADSPKRLEYLRTRIWWKGNDPIRKKKRKELTARHRENLEALLELNQGGDPGSRLTKAEILRELGRFEEAAEVIEGEFPDDCDWVLKFLRKWIGKREARVKKR
ncbi:MAG: hypothetical protein DVB23_000597 [Verrucomicrobia bacterium]|nr:MAG: hypothetical protein DVB23_000597 [Verrucomicrobiota bacterium]